ncbi:MAG: hypothetical protein JO270_26305 [Acidobacteriaceae bacterium]|nr:hypothetical protein [Acidobacteriaceae bacterium]MBV8572962.1 hypothetical protein [Acidobacteriaceae bacterium]
MFKAIALTIAAGAALLAQTTVNSGAGEPGKQIMIRQGDMADFGPVGITAAFAGPMSTVAGAPYSAQTSTERVQILADGNRIDQTNTGTVARDSQGRVRREETLPPLSSNSSDGPRLVFIDDPVAGVHWNLDAQTKTALKMPFTLLKAKIPAGAAVVPPPPPGPDKTWFFSSAAAAPGGGVQIVTKTAGTLDSNAAKTDLGTQNVEGVAAQGTRITRTIPAGTVGNAMPIIITTETWYSPDLKVLVMSKTSDPRMGETTYRLTNIQRAEPPASLFQVPEDYTIKDQPGNNFVYREFRKNE